MAKTKLSVSEKREIARKEILDVSLELFLKKGYNETTTRDIITKAGILNGSLYNRFKNKDEILISLVKEAVNEVLDKSASLFNDVDNILVASSFPGAIQIYIASRSQNIANLLYEVHKSWNAVEEYVDIHTEWSKKFINEFGFNDVNPERLRIILTSLIGSIGNLMGYYSHGGKMDGRELISHHILLVASVLRMPVMNIEQVTDKLMGIIESGDLVFMGHNLTKEIPELGNPKE